MPIAEPHPQTLSEHEQTLYGRQMLIPGWGKEGQERIKAAEVFIAGAGGLGSPVAIYLAVAGVGQIHICDADEIELSNLNRQILHTQDRIGQPKVASAFQTLTRVNPSVNIFAHQDYIDASSVERVVGQPDLIIDCLDNYETRYLLNRYGAERGIPFIHGAIESLVGQITFLQPPETACLQCIFPQAPPKRTFPVVGATPGVIGTLQAMEALKYLTHTGSVLKNRLLIFDGTDMTFAPIEIRRRPGCPICSDL